MTAEPRVASAPGAGGKDVDRADGDRGCPSSPTQAADAAPPAVTVFYDGGCPLCAAEIGFYRRRRGADGVLWVDVSASATEDVAAGLTRDQALRRFHVRDGDGRLVSGGRAFAVLWAALPGYAWLGRLFRLQPLAWTIDRAYDRFLGWRPRLQALARRRARAPENG